MLIIRWGDSARGGLRWHHGWTSGVQDDISGIVAQIQQVSSPDGRLPG